MKLGKKVYVVEDDFEIRESVCDLLRDEGYDVAAAENGDVAIKHLNGVAATDNLPSLILLDITMPVLDGYGFRSAQMKNPKLAHIPTAMISADGNVKQKALLAGVTDFLRKPVELNDLLSLVARHCQ